jgi:N-acetylmuramoyl-L-alanine amidase
MADGLSVYTLSETASDKEAALLAAKENKADLISGINFQGENKEVSSILIDLVQRETMNMSARFATELVRELSQRVVVREKTHRFAGFMVLKAPDTPAALLEMGYISNPREEYQLRQSQYRARIVAGIVAATNSFFNANTVR